MEGMLERYKPEPDGSLIVTGRVARRESGLLVVESERHKLEAERRRFFHEEFMPVAERTVRFSDYLQDPSDRFPWIGGTLASHVHRLVGDTAFYVDLENTQYYRHLNRDRALVIAKFEDLGEADPDNPGPDEATNGKSHGSRERELARLRTMIGRAGSQELRQQLEQEITPLVQEVPMAELAAEARLVKVLESLQHLLENALRPSLDLEAGQQYLSHQHELIFDVIWHVIEKLLQDGREFPSVLQTVAQYRQRIIRLIHRYHLNVDRVHHFTTTLRTINPNRQYPDPDVIVAQMRVIPEQLYALPDPNGFRPLRNGESVYVNPGRFETYSIG